MTKAATPEAAPEGDGLTVWHEVMLDFTSRVKFGQEKYGTTLRTFNGRDATNDSYQELLDAIIYMKQAALEREHYRKALKKIAKATESTNSLDPGAAGSALLAAWGIATAALHGREW